MPEQIISLNELPLGSSLKIIDISGDSAVVRRLDELGFCKNAVIDKLNTGYGGSPCAVRVSGAVIAVRSSDAENIKGCQAD